MEPRSAENIINIGGPKTAVGVDAARLNGFHRDGIEMVLTQHAYDSGGYEGFPHARIGSGD